MSYNENFEGWQPKNVPLGGVLTSGAATFFINDGAGVYLSLDGFSDSTFYFNDSLNRPNFQYDGSDLAILLHARTSISGGGGDTVGLILEYSLVELGDNSATTSTVVAQQNIDVSGESQNIQFDTTLATMTGVTDAHAILVTVTRNASGAGADTFIGDFEITGIELVKV